MIVWRKMLKYNSKGIVVEESTLTYFDWYGNSTDGYYDGSAVTNVDTTTTFDLSSPHIWNTIDLSPGMYHE